MEWICNECASYNDSSDQRCHVCGAVRPAEVLCVCPGCQSVLRAFPGMRCGRCGRVFTDVDLSDLRYEPDLVPPAPAPVPLPYSYMQQPVPVPQSGTHKTAQTRVGVLITALVIFIVVGSLAALFIVKFFDSRKTDGDGAVEPSSVASAQETGSQAAADAWPPSASRNGPFTGATNAPSVTYTAVITDAPAPVSYPVAYVSDRTPDHEGVNMRSEPASDSLLILTLGEGAQVYVLGSTSGEYTLVQTVNGDDRGWVLERYLVKRGSTAPALSSYDFYEATISNYGSTQVERFAQMGYAVNTPVYEYAIKDINSDGTDELVIREKTVFDDGTTTPFHTGAIYTLDKGFPVELYFISRHGSCYVTSDGYIVFSYKGAIIQKIVGAGLITVAEYNIHDGTFDGEEEDFLRANGVSTAEMTFDFIPFNG